MARYSYKAAPGMPSPSYCQPNIFMAVRIARVYRDRVPSPKQLMADYGMSRATAYRWIAALRGAA